MHFPDCRARLPDLIRMLGVEHDPAVDAHSLLISGDSLQRIDAPVWMIDTYGRSHFDNNRITPVVASRLGQLDMKIAKLMVGAMTIG